MGVIVKKMCSCALFLLVFSALSVSAFADIYMPITGTLKPYAGSGSQTNDDLVINGNNLGSSQLSCSRSTSGGDYIYSITFIEDLDGLVAYWNLNKGSGTAAQDSVSGYTRTIYGAQWILE